MTEINKKNCLAAVRIPLRTAKKSSDKIYCIIEEKYKSVNKGKEKTREIAYRRCVKESKIGCIFCSSHSTKSKKIPVKLFTDLIKMENIQILNEPRDKDDIGDNRTSIISVHQPLKIKKTPRTINKIKKIIEKESIQKNSSCESDNIRAKRIFRRNTKPSSGKIEKELESKFNSELKSELESELESKLELESESESGSEPNIIFGKVKTDDFLESPKNFNQIDIIENNNNKKKTKIYISVDNKIVGKRDPIFLDNENYLVFKDETVPLGKMLKVTKMDAPIIHNGFNWSVCKEINRDGKIYQRCIITNYIYRLNSDNQLVYVGNFKNGIINFIYI